MKLDEAFKQVKEHTAKFQTEEALDASENDLIPTETLQSDTDLRESEEEERESEQKTAVAAARSNRNDLKPQFPLGMELVKEHYADSMRNGLPERSAMHSDPPAGQVAWPVPEDLPESINVNNLILAHIELGKEAEVAPFAQRCNETTQHIIVITFTSQDRSRSTEMLRFLQLAQRRSLYHMCLYRSGKQNAKQRSWRRFQTNVPRL